MTSNAGLVDFLFRRYPPAQGRWISPDPAGLGAVDISNPQTWNRYAYVANNPLNAIDPLGLCPVSGYAPSRLGGCSNTRGGLGGCGGDPVCSGNGMIVDGVLTSVAMGQALLDVGLAKPCAPCSGWVIDENGNIEWVHFEVHDVGNNGPRPGVSVQSGFFNIFATPDDGKGVTITSPYGSAIPPWPSPQPALIEAPGPAGSLQSCVWGTKGNTLCSEGFGGKL